MDPEDEQLRKDLLIASAYFHGWPSINGRYVASCAKVLLHALNLAELGTVDVAAAKEFFFSWHDRPEGDLARTWYATLIGLTNQEPTSARLLEGEGNLELPAAAAFTACWPRPPGKNVAERLLVENHQWPARLTAAM